MAKLVQFKDKDGVIYPKGIIENILSTPVQASSTIATNVTATLSGNYIKYDVIACRIAVGINGSEGVWCLVFPKLQGNLQTQYYCNIYDTGYAFAGRVILVNNNQIQFMIQHQKGWNNNSVWLNKVVGIRLT